MNELVDNIVPSWAVMSFDLETCPDGWSEYTQAYGRVVRGIDKSWGNIDADWERTIWSIQWDAIRNITWRIKDFAYQSGKPWWTGSGAFIKKDGVWDWAITVSDYNVLTVVSNQDSLDFDASLVVPTANENRMKNVALLYCKKD